MRRRSLLAAAASASLAGCRPARTPDRLTEDLGRALTGGDRSSFVDCFAAPAEALADRLWRNWTALRVERPAWDGATIRVRWRAPGEREGAVETLSIAFSGGRIGALVPTGPTPLWLPGPLTVRAAPGAALLADADVPDAVAGAWLRAAGEASRIVASAGLAGAARQWDGVLVVGLPGTTEAFADTAGLAAAQAAATQAATVMADAGSAPRVTLHRSGTAALDPAGRRAVLVHEGVHAATRSAVSAAPLWLVEGVAESVTAAADPATRARNATLLAAADRPTGLPTRADLDGPAADVAYARAALAVDAASARWGRPAVMAWLADWTAPGRPDEAELADAFLTAAPG
nr:hypothetical protein [Propionibacterium sp.]